MCTHHCCTLTGLGLSPPPTSHKCVVTVNNCCGRKQTTTRYLRTASLTWLLQEVGDVILPSCCEKLPAPVLVVVRSFLHGITHIWCLDSHVIKHKCMGLLGLSASYRPGWPHSAGPTDIYMTTETSLDLSCSHYTPADIIYSVLPVLYHRPCQNIGLFSTFTYFLARLSKYSVKNLRI